MKEYEIVDVEGIEWNVYCDYNLIATFFAEENATLFVRILKIKDLLET